MSFADQPLSPSGGSDTMSMEQAQQIISNLEKLVSERDDAIKQLSSQNMQLNNIVQSNRYEYETQIETLQTELETSQFELRDRDVQYQDAKEQLTELQGNEEQVEVAINERHRAQQDYNRISKDYQNLRKQFIESEKSRHQTNEAYQESIQNVSKLQKTLLNLTKEKNDIQSKFSKYIQSTALREQNLNEEIDEWQNAYNTAQEEVDQLRQSVYQSESDKVRLQSEFTQATMDLIQSDINSKNEPIRESTALRLPIQKKDLNQPGPHMRGGSQISVASSVGGDADSNDNNVAQFISHRQQMSNSVALADDDLQHQLQQSSTQYHGMHGRSDSQYSNVSSNMGGSPRGHSRRLSMNTVENNLLRKLQSFLNNELTNSLKTIVAVELNNIDIKDQLDTIPKQMEHLVSKLLNDKVITDLTEKFEQFQIDVTKSLRKTLQTMDNNNNNEEEIKNAMNEALNDIRNKLDNPETMMNEMRETMTDQFSNLEIRIENMIGNNVKRAMSQGVKKDVSMVINDELKKPLETINETLEKISQNNINNNGSNVGSKQDSNNTVVIDELGKKMEEILGDNLEQSMQDRVDKFMDSFRKEVIPDLQAIFDQIGSNQTKKSMSKLRNKMEDDTDSTHSSDDNDEKYDENKNEYQRKINALEERILEMMQEEKQLREELHFAATSKTGSLLRLQNIIDHLRFDNRVLMQNLNAFKLRDAMYEEEERESKGIMSSIIGSIVGLSGNARQKIIHVNISNMDYMNDYADNAANAAVGVMARAVNAGINAQNNVST